MKNNPCFSVSPRGEDIAQTQKRAPLGNLAGEDASDRLDTSLVDPHRKFNYLLHRLYASTKLRENEGSTSSFANSRRNVSHVCFGGSQSLRHNLKLFLSIIIADNF